MKVAALIVISAIEFGGAFVNAQEPMGHAMPDSVARSSVSWMLGAEAIADGTIASPAYANRTLREGYLTQPMVMGMLSAASGRIGVEGMVDFEGITLERGELNAGMEGEGYVDRRHPHTYLHELVASGSGSYARTRFSLAIGKGFVPFGTDDPMVRPFEKYPANHHISQIVERLLAAATVRRGLLLLEAARFNGDEPESPSDLPNSGRLWDSWATRATILPRSGFELAGSVARVKSPELAAGGGLDQRKVNISFRYESANRQPMSMGPGDEMDPAMEIDEARGNDWHRYGLIEWGRSSDYDRSTRAFSFSTMLAEGELRQKRIAFGARLERTERPEEERLANPFRTQRPATDFSVVGRTRWDIATARVSAIAWKWTTGSISPFIEVARQHATALAVPAVFDPRGFYGSDTMWSISAGITFSAGMVHDRTGQYGAAARGMTGMQMRGTHRIAGCPKVIC
jgi:hypothetical protein